MNRLLMNRLRSSLHPYVTSNELDEIMDGTADSRYGKVRRLLSHGDLLHIRRGLYCLTDQVGYFAKPHPFELAQYIYGPSYISLESALSFHKLIPEAAYTITSVCAKRSNTFHTPLGEFVYLRLPKEDFYTFVDLMKENNNPFFMAKPWKAICDYVYCYKKDWYSLDPLLNNLRISVGDLPPLEEEEINLLADYYHHRRLTRFLKSIKRELG